MAVTFTLNGKPQTVDVSPQMPLLWVLRDSLGMTGTKFGCGMALCGCCTVHLNGQPIRSCVTPISNVAGKSVTTIEGLSSDNSHPVQRAWIEVDVPQCGYCQSGQIMTAAGLLKKTAHPTDADIDEAMHGNICRCGTYQAIRHAVHLAAQYQAAANRRSHGCGERSGRRRSMSASHYPNRRATQSPQLLEGRRRHRRWPVHRVPSAGEQQAGSRHHCATKLNAFIHVGSDDIVTVLDPQIGNGPRADDFALAVAGGRAGLRLETGPDRICACRSGLWPAAGHLRQHEHPHLLGSAAQSGRVGSRHAAGCRRSEMGRRKIAASHRKRAGNQYRNQRAFELRQSGGRRRQAAGARQSGGERSEGFSSDRNIAQAAGHAAQSKRHGRIWHRCAASGHGLRGAAALPGVRRQSGQLRRYESQGRSRRASRWCRFRAAWR